MNNVERTIISQYANSPTICGLIDYVNQWVDPRTDLDTFYSYVWDVLSAQGFGLDIWGRIVGVGRDITYSGNTPTFGFVEAFTTPTQAALTGPNPFDTFPFFNGQQTSQTYTLSDDAYRTLILVKALANITDCSIPAFNELLNKLFAGRGRCYVIDQGSMSMRFVFEFALQPFEVAIMTQQNVIPRPAGVQSQVMQLDVAGTFGFNEMGAVQTFDNGTFFDNSGIII